MVSKLTDANRRTIALGALRQIILFGNSEIVEAIEDTLSDELIISFDDTTEEDVYAIENVLLNIVENLS